MNQTINKTEIKAAIIFLFFGKWHRKLRALVDIKRESIGHMTVYIVYSSQKRVCIINYLCATRFKHSRKSIKWLFCYVTEKRKSCQLHVLQKSKQLFFHGDFQAANTFQAVSSSHVFFSAPIIRL